MGDQLRTAERVLSCHTAFREFGRSVLVKGLPADLKTAWLGMITETAEERYKNCSGRTRRYFSMHPETYRFLPGHHRWFPQPYPEGIFTEIRPRSISCHLQQAPAAVCVVSLRKIQAMEQLPFYIPALFYSGAFTHPLFLLNPPGFPVPLPGYR